MNKLHKVGELMKQSVSIQKGKNLVITCYRSLFIFNVKNANFSLQIEKIHSKFFFPNLPRQFRYVFNWLTQLHNLSKQKFSNDKLIQKFFTSSHWFTQWLILFINYHFNLLIHLYTLQYSFILIESGQNNA